MWQSMFEDIDDALEGSHMAVSAYGAAEDRAVREHAQSRASLEAELRELPPTLDEYSRMAEARTTRRRLAARRQADAAAAVAALQRHEDGQDPSATGANHSLMFHLGAQGRGPSAAETAALQGSAAAADADFSDPREQRASAPAAAAASKRRRRKRAGDKEAARVASREGLFSLLDDAYAVEAALEARLDLLAEGGAPMATDPNDPVAALRANLGHNLVEDEVAALHIELEYTRRQNADAVVSMINDYDPKPIVGFRQRERELGSADLGFPMPSEIIAAAENEALRSMAPARPSTGGTEGGGDGGGGGVLEFGIPVGEDLAAYLGETGGGSLLPLDRPLSSDDRPLSSLGRPGSSSGGDRPGSSAGRPGSSAGGKRGGGGGGGGQKTGGVLPGQQKTGGLVMPGVGIVPAMERAIASDPTHALPMRQLPAMPGHDLGSATGGAGLLPPAVPNDGSIKSMVQASTKELDLGFPTLESYNRGGNEERGYFMPGYQPPTYEHQKEAPGGFWSSARHEAREHAEAERELGGADAMAMEEPARQKKKRTKRKKKAKPKRGASGAGSVAAEMFGDGGDQDHDERL